MTYIGSLVNTVQSCNTNSTTKNILIFDVWGDFAHFKKSCIIKSALTYIIPPRNTVAGLIGAILGIKRNRISEILSPQVVDIGITLLSEGCVHTLTINQILTISSKDSRLSVSFTQYAPPIPIQFLINPKFRIYFSSNDKELFSQLEYNLKNHLCYYTPTLGLSNLICNFRFLKNIEARKYVGDNFVKVISAVPRNNIKDIDITQTKGIKIERAPRHLYANRSVTAYQEIIIPTNKKENYLVIRPKKELWEIKNGLYISFL